MKSLVKAFVMAVVLFAYGYIFSVAGHNHAGHSQMKGESAHVHEDGHAH